jgi:hypothetical protein
MSSKSVKKVAKVISRIKGDAIKVASFVVDASRDIDNDESSLTDDFIDKYKSQSDSEDTIESENVVPTDEEAKIVVKRALFKIAKVPRKTIADIDAFERDVLKGRDFISSHSERYPFLSAVYTGDYYDMKGLEALESLLKEIREVKKMVDDEERIIDYAYINCNALYKDASIQ